jgi:hypothetical protein
MLCTPAAATGRTYYFLLLVIYSYLCMVLNQDIGKMHHVVHSPATTYVSVLSTLVNTGKQGW